MQHKVALLWSCNCELSVQAAGLVLMNITVAGPCLLLVANQLHEHSPATHILACAYRTSPTGLSAATTVGRYVTIGQGCVLRSATVEDEVLIGEKCVLMEGSLVENHCVLAPGTVLPPGRLVPSGQLWAGNPAKYVRDLTKDEVRALPCPGGGTSPFCTDIVWSLCHVWLLWLLTKDTLVSMVQTILVAWSMEVLAIKRGCNFMPCVPSFVAQDVNIVQVARPVASRSVTSDRNAAHCAWFLCRKLRLPTLLLLFSRQQTCTAANFCRLAQHISRQRSSESL